MHDQEPEIEDVDQKLEAMDAKLQGFVELVLLRSATRLAGEMRRLARSEQRLIPYIRACFTLMNLAVNVFEPESGRDRAIELISLLESEDRARTIQPDLPEFEYAAAVAWMTACAYDNLAKATASLNGYNSDGMHQCIGDGIEVCRRTGKLQCITCFREYATDVYKAADDLDMALHFARLGIANQDPGPHDRRWIGARDLTTLLLLRGELEAAAEAAERTWNLAATYHAARHARLETRLIMREIFHVMGDSARADKLSSIAKPGDGPPRGKLALDDPPAGEFAWYEMSRDQTEAVVACCGGEYPRALELLLRWDRVLTDRHVLKDWFDNRLRLLAVHRLAGNERELSRLSKPLETKARSARDWLTLRCLARILDPSVAPAPVPLVADLRVGPFAARTFAPAAAVATAPGAPAAAVEEAKTGEQPQAEPAAERAAPPERVQAFWSRIATATATDVDSENRQEATDAILRDMLAIEPATITDKDEACWLIHTGRCALGDCSRGRDVWQWAESIAAPHKQDATILSLLAALGAALRFGPNEELSDLVSEQRLETMFRESLDLDANLPRNFGRAGSYFLFMENLDEAERCFARGFRLNRRDGNLALNLADVYSRTDRTRDSLAVLDICLREGCEDSKVPWKALLTAFQFEQYEATLTYVDRYEELAPGQPWANYYRAASLLELGRAAEALTAAEEESRRNPQCPFSVMVLTASAVGMLGRTDEFRDRLAAVLEAPLAEVNYLSQLGLCHLFRRLWFSATCLPVEDRLHAQLEDRMLAADLAPNEMFDAKRKSLEAVSGVNFYEVETDQPLDERWPSWPGCLAGESDWMSYTIPWGVLARTEDEAQQLVELAQSRCYPIPPTVREVRPGGQDYTDSPGIVWQGFRAGVSPES